MIQDRVMGYLAIRADLVDAKADILKRTMGTIGVQTLAILGGVATLFRMLRCQAKPLRSPLAHFLLWPRLTQPGPRLRVCVLPRGLREERRCPSVISGMRLGSRCRSRLQRRTPADR